MATRLKRRYKLRDATADDFDGIIKIVNSKNNRASFGWVPKVVLADAVRETEANGSASRHSLRVVADHDGRVVAFIRIYHRLDGVTSLHEIGVAEDCQSSGIGSYLVLNAASICRKRGMETLRLKTPIGMRSNKFYPRFGFKKVGTHRGRKRRLNIYELSL